jgi:hypothetical protein
MPTIAALITQYILKKINVPSIGVPAVAKEFRIQCLPVQYFAKNEVFHIFSI